MSVDPLPLPLRPKTAVLSQGFDPKLSVGSLRPAVFRSSSYAFSTPEEAEQAFVRDPSGEGAPLSYARFNHPNAEILEAQVLPLEPGAASALVFNSGMSAIATTLLALVEPHGNLLYAEPLYEGTRELIQNVLVPRGMGAVGVAPEALAQAVGTMRPSAIYIETPTDPLLRMVDVAAVAEAATALDPVPLLLADNSSFGPAFQHLHPLGVDVVLYSATKYLAGSGDVMAGVAFARRPGLLDPVRSLRSVVGTILQPDECWILNGRLPTVGLRMRHAAESARMLAESLSGHRKLAGLFYPTLVNDAAQRRVFETQCELPGALLTLDLAGGKRAAFDLLRHLRLARIAISIGGMETVVCHPRTTTHARLSAMEADRVGVHDGLVRVSVGLEDWRDLLADFEQALAACG